MYWQENTDEQQGYQVPDDIVDLSFKIICSSLPLDHAHALSSALLSALPWMKHEEHAGVHLIHGAESGNGWIRPDSANDVLYLSRRTRLTLRLPKQRLEDANRIQGHTLNIAGNELTLGNTTLHKLSTLTTIFARHVVSDENGDEALFLQEAAKQLKIKGIYVKKMMSGRKHTHEFPDRTISTRSLMIDGLQVEESVALQQEGLGTGRKFGFGLFLPHKGIDAVNQQQH